jgi:P2-related tail formation protein
MKKLIYVLMLSLSVFAFLPSQEIKISASSDPMVILNLDTNATYNTTGEIYLPAGTYDVLDPNNGYSQIMSLTVYGQVIITTNLSGKLEFSYDDEGNWVTYPTAYQSIIFSSSSAVSVMTSTGGSYSMANLQITAQDLRPAFSGQETFVTNVDDAKPLSFFLSYIHVFDNVDGDLTSQIYVVTDNYTANSSVLGAHTVTLGVEDTAGNVSTFEFTINVVDITKPVINGNSAKATISYTQTYNIEAFRSTLTATDNYSTLSNAQITVESDGYTSNKTALGTYSIVFKVTDTSGNSNTFTKQVEVIDDVAPMISGQQTYTKDATAILLLDTIKANLTATDVKDGNRTAYITVKEDNYTGNGNKVGTYTITFEVADTKNNKSTFVVTLNVVDDIPGVWYIADGVSIVLIPPMQLTHEQIINLLQKTGQISVSSTSHITFFMDEYTGNEETPGVYAMGFNFSNAAGQSSVHTFAITVTEASDENPIILDPNTSWIDSSLTWVSDNPFIFVGLFMGVVFVIVIAVAVNTKKPAKKYHSKKSRRGY